MKKSKEKKPIFQNIPITMLGAILAIEINRLNISL
jgi:hypothetical protein